MENNIDLKQIEKEVLAENKVRMVNDDFQLVLPAQRDEQANASEGKVLETKQEVNRTISVEESVYTPTPTSYSFHEDELRHRVAFIHKIGTNPANRPITSKREGIKGIVVFVKRVIRKLIRWYVEPISAQQSEFNQETVMLTSRMVDEIRDMGNYVTNVVEAETREALGRISGDMNNLAHRNTEHGEMITNIMRVSEELQATGKRYETEIGVVARDLNVVKSGTREALGMISGNINNLALRSAEHGEMITNITRVSEELQEAVKRYETEISKLDVIEQELKAETQRNEEKINRMTDVVRFLEENHLGDVVISLADRMKNEEDCSRLYQEQMNQLLLSNEALQRDVRMLQEELNQQKPKYEFGSILSSSQSGEDTIVAYILDSLKIPFNKCTYLDLGANHPMRMNNSYMLYRFGARGVLVEANPTLAKELQTQRPGDIVLNRCITDTTGESIRFYVMNGDGLSTFDAERVAQNMNANDLLRIEQVVNVETITMQDILDTYFREPPVLVSVDIEGDELRTLESLNLQNMRPLIVIVETIEYSPHLQVKQKKNDVINYMDTMGYAEYAFTGINSIFVDVNRLHS